MLGQFFQKFPKMGEIFPIKKPAFGDQKRGSNSELINSVIQRPEPLSRPQRVRPLRPEL